MIAKEGRTIKKAYMNNLESGEKMALSEYYIQVHHKSDEIIELTTNQYSFEDAFGWINEYYENRNNESIEKVIVQVKR